MRLPRKLKKKAKKHRKHAEIINAIEGVHYRYFIESLKRCPKPTSEQWNAAVKRCIEQGII